MDSRGVWQTVCACLCDGFSRCCAVSCSMTSNKRQPCSGAAPGHAATSDVNITRSSLLLRFTLQLYTCPRLNVKTRVGLFPVQNPNYPHSLQAAPGGSRLGTDWWTGCHTHIYSLFSFTTHTHAGKLEQRGGLSWPNSLCGSPFDLCTACGKADLDHKIQHKAISRLQAASRFVCNVAPCVFLTDVIFCSSNRIISGGSQRPLTCFLLMF